MTPDNYGQQSDDLRRELAVAQVVCVAAGDGARDAMTAFADRLIEGVRAKNTPLCVGLDPFPETQSRRCSAMRARTLAPSLKFGAAIIDIAAQHAAVLKPQLGLFEQFGADGLRRRPHPHASTRSKPACWSCSTPSAAISAPPPKAMRAPRLGAAPGFDADCVTVNPYIGRDTLEPFIALRRGERQRRGRAGAHLQSRRRRFAGSAGRRRAAVAARGGDARAAKRAPEGRERLVGADGGRRRDLSRTKRARCAKRCRTRCSWCPATARKAPAPPMPSPDLCTGPKGREGGVVSSSRAVHLSTGGAGRDHDRRLARRDR